MTKDQFREILIDLADQVIMARDRAEINQIIEIIIDNNSDEIQSRNKKD